MQKIPKKIRVLTLIMNSLNDPFLDRATFPKPEEVSDYVELEYHEKGGHAGFIVGSPWKKTGWSEIRIPEFFKTQLNS